MSLLDPHGTVATPFHQYRWNMFVCDVELCVQCLQVTSGRANKQIGAIPTVCRSTRRWWVHRAVFTAAASAWQTVAIATDHQQTQRCS